ncbi:DUF3141 domain-containing protein [Elioraea sp.]|uniref:DUF3141 domain-containing protein n=1 Tax=Elioraea sp. TaxID=2185103 RepID=UPI0025C11805|nr:DUF3141 domain-containing protein [Elioraea sp.]
MTDRMIGTALDPFGFWEWVADAQQRNILFLDTMRARGNQYLAHEAETVPHVLSFDHELVMSGAGLQRPVNYGLVRIPPPEGAPQPQPGARPFVVVDPRAGHGPGIGGFKADSEIGMAIAAGHPCYFIGFTPTPFPEQTLEDVVAAEAAFVAEVARRHPDAEGKPCVIGNCQAGWQTMIAAATRPEAFGPIILAGSPLSYWNGTRGFAPMRYTGGMLGGSWLAHMTGDLGAGLFDGAWLVTNFEQLNPANTFWSKQFNLWRKVDTEGPRYLGFERWWGGHVLLTAPEMAWIADNLFVGNRLSANQLALSHGTAVDLRDVAGPIVVFCSRGDDITPPGQALGWITDLYADVSEIRAHDQTIVYCVHETIGHLGIFVSSGVSKKEHREFTENIDLIDVLPPGLYEAVLSPRKGAAGDALISGDYVVTFEPRTLDHIRGFGINSAEDDRAFAAAARISEQMLGLYRTFAQPAMRSMANEQAATAMRRLHPARLPYEMLSDRNPLVRMVEGVAETTRAARRPAAPDNPFVALQDATARAIETTLKAWGEARDRMVETMFFGIYGSPIVQALAGVAGSAPVRHRPGRDPGHEAQVAALTETLRGRIGVGGAPEAFLRGLMHVRDMAGADERSFAVLEALRGRLPEGPMSLAAFKAMLRDQCALMVLDRKAALAAMPAMVPEDAARRQRMLEGIRMVAEATGPLDATAEARLAEIAALLGPPAPANERAAANDRGTPRSAVKARRKK